ncbi:RUN domain containing 1 [Sparganum proliferum]
MPDGDFDPMVSTPDAFVANFNENANELTEILDENGKPMVRWAPLGANDGNETCNESDFSEDHKLRNIMEEHEVLNTALLSLTSHFAQVQFRLEQVLHSDPEQKEILLKELEQFAWKGVPDLHFLRNGNGNVQENQSDVPNGRSVEKEQKCYVPLIIDQLKTQLDDLEQFAYKSGELSHPPTLSIMEKQKILLNELEQRLGLNIPELQSMSEEEIRDHIDAAIMQLTRPIETKQALVDQLKTQINDLERFIEFLHDDQATDSTIIKALQSFKQYQEDNLKSTQQSKLPAKIRPQGGRTVDGNQPSGFHVGLTRRRKSTSDTRDNDIVGQKVDPDASSGKLQDQKTIGLITRALAVLHLFAFGRGTAARAASTNGPVDRINASKGNTTWSSEAAQAKTHHWGDYRARLELAVAEVLEKAEHLQNLRSMQRLEALDHPPGAPTATNLQSPSFKVAPAKQPIADNPADEFRKLRQQSVGKGRQNTSVGALDSISCLSDSNTAAVLKADRELNLAVRRVLCPALELLIEHGLRVPSRSSTSGATHVSDDVGILARWGFGCFSRRPTHASHGYVHDSSPDEDEDDDEVMSDGYEGQGERRRYAQKRRKKSSVTAWSLFLKYYVMKNGRAFNDTPARKLSESFALDIIGGKAITAKQQLLSSMGTILQLFNKYKRSDECQFRALVCMALNSHKLVAWLKLVLRSPFIVQYMYHPWSYVASTGFDDALQSLNKLSAVEFDLPFDANVRRLQEIQDVI